MYRKPKITEIGTNWNMIAAVSKLTKKNHMFLPKTAEQIPRTEIQKTPLETNKSQ